MHNLLNFWISETTEQSTSSIKFDLKASKEKIDNNKQILAAKEIGHQNFSHGKSKHHSSLKISITFGHDLRTERICCTIRSNCWQYIFMYISYIYTMYISFGSSQNKNKKLFRVNFSKSLHVIFSCLRFWSNFLQMLEAIPIGTL